MAALVPGTNRRPLCVSSSALVPVDVMIDLETLGTKPGSVVLSIGAVACQEGLEFTFYKQIDLRDSLYAGLEADPDTLSWWRKLNREAWLASTKRLEGVGDGLDTLKYVLEMFSDWLQDLRKGPDSAPTGRTLRLWGDAASFDLTLLSCAYRAAGVAVPWLYTEEACYRTLRAVLNSPKPASKLQHDALGDAQAQMVHLQEMLKVFAGLTGGAP